MQTFLTPQARRALGKARRQQLHRQHIAKWSREAQAVDPMALLAGSMRGRVRSLVALKYERMELSPFAFFRGAVPIMAADLASHPNTAIMNQICGDAHVRNLGAFAAPDGRLVFDINDFDETIVGPFEWDLKRLATSLVLAGRESGQKKSCISDAVIIFAERYRKSVAMFSRMPVLEVARYQVHRLQRIAPVSKALLKAERSTPLNTLAQLTHVVEGKRVFRENKPILTRTVGSRRAILKSLEQYRETLLPERRHFLDQYRPLDVAFKVVGTGSVGLRCYVLLMEGNDERDPLFLQIKEEVRSAYAPYLPALASPPQEGQRTAEGQRAMQFQSDPMLGWTTIAGRNYLVRQLNDHKGSIDVEDMAGSGLIEYAQICGELLARGHCRSGDACMLIGYLGNSSRFDEALESFAFAYAAQTERDWELLKKSGR